MIANHSLHSPMQPHHPTLTYFYFFFFNDTATTEIYTLSLHDALPIRLYHGIADDWVPIGPCRDYVARLKKAGANADLVEYPGAYHAFDNQTIPGTLQLPQAQTWRKCRLEEKPQGVIVNRYRSAREF